MVNYCKCFYFKFVLVNIYIYIYIYIYISNCVKCKQIKVNAYALYSRANVRLLNGWVGCYWSDVKLGRFQSQLEASRVSSHTEEL